MTTTPCPHCAWGTLDDGTCHRCGHQALAADRRATPVWQGGEGTYQPGYTPILPAPTQCGTIASEWVGPPSVTPTTATVEDAAPLRAARDLDGAREFVRALIERRPIWPNSYGQDVGMAAYVLTDGRTGCAMYPRDGSGFPPAQTDPCARARLATDPETGACIACDGGPCLPAPCARPECVADRESLREKCEFWERAATAEGAYRRDQIAIIVAYLRRAAARKSLSFERDMIDELADAIEDNVANVAQCPFACPHNDQCTLEVGHDGGHNFRGCDCNDPVTPPCDRCGKRLSADDMEHTITGDGWNLYLCEQCSHAERMHDR